LSEFFLQSRDPLPCELQFKAQMLHLAQEAGTLLMDPLELSPHLRSVVDVTF